MAQFDRRRTLKLMASLGAAGASVPLLSACGSDTGPSGTAEVNKGPIKIGLMVPQDGIFKAIGEDVQHGQCLSGARPSRPAGSQGRAGRLVQ